MSKKIVRPYLLILFVLFFSGSAWSGSFSGLTWPEPVESGNTHSVTGTYTQGYNSGQQIALKRKGSCSNNADGSSDSETWSSKGCTACSQTWSWNISIRADSTRSCGIRFYGTAIAASKSKTDWYYLPLKQTVTWTGVPTSAVGGAGSSPIIVTADVTTMAGTPTSSTHYLTATGQCTYDPNSGEVTITAAGQCTLTAAVTTTDVWTGTSDSVNNLSETIDEAVLEKTWPVTFLVDSDGDSVTDDVDNCVAYPNADQADNYGVQDGTDGTGDRCEDSDTDTKFDYEDNCPTVWNQGQENVFGGNAAGDACDDFDNDTVVDNVDNCQAVANTGQADNWGLQDGSDGSGDACEDTDGDSLVDSTDNCPSVPNLDQSNVFGGSPAGDACDDVDGDGTGDKIDNCPVVSNANQANNYGSFAGDACEDTDGDSINDETDNCPVMANNSQLDANANGIGDLCESDTDGDGVDDYDGLNAGGIDDGMPADNCPTIVNANQSDMDNDSIGDVCDDDRDGDGINNDDDQFPDISIEGFPDHDNDGSPDTCASNACAGGMSEDTDDDNDTIADNAPDNCPMGNGINNDDDHVTDQTNTDLSLIGGDSYGDLCDDDDDADGVLDVSDNCPINANGPSAGPGDQLDSDGDLAGDVCDNDDDDDGVDDVVDNCPLISNNDQINLDGDSFGDVCESDSDSDGVSDSNGVSDTDNCPYVPNADQVDLNNNGMGDVCEVMFVDINVDQAESDGSCTSWANACIDIQTAVDNAISEGALAVYIAKGTYELPATISNLPPGIAIVGGFSGTETQINQSRPDSNPTIISGVNVNRLFDINIASVVFSDAVVFNGLTLADTGSSSTPAGAAIKVTGSRAEIHAVDFTGNTAINGGALSIEGGAVVRVSDSVFSANEITGNGAAIYVNGSSAITVDNSEFNTNKARNGAAIYALMNSTVDVNSSLFNGNVATVAAGAIYSQGALNIEQSDFSDNSAVGSAGAVKAEAAVNIDTTSFKGNNAENDGGALVLSSSAANSIQNSSFTDNVTATGNGGAVYAAGSQVLDVLNSTFHKNTAPFGHGGAIQLSDTATVDVHFVTLVANQATQGGAIQQSENTTLVVRRSLIVGNSASGLGNNLYLFDAMNDGGFNLIGFNNEAGVKPDGQYDDTAVTGSFIAEASDIASIVSTSPSTSFADSNQPSTTLMLELTAGSEARDAMPLSDCGGVGLDQRGGSRPDSATGMCDIGAFEFDVLTCKEKAKNLQDLGNNYIVNCDPSNEWLIDLGSGLNVGTMNYVFLLLLSIFGMFRYKCSRLY